MIAEIGKKKKVSKSAESVSYPPGLKPSLIKNQYQSLSEEEEEAWMFKESGEKAVNMSGKHEFKAVNMPSKHEFNPVRKQVSNPVRKVQRKVATKEIAEVGKRVKIGIDSCAAETMCVHKDGQMSSRWNQLNQERC